MPMDWEATETWQRLIAAIYASGAKPNLKLVAQYYGTTYNTLENKFRGIKKLGEELKEEVDSGQRGEISPIRKKSAPSTPRKPKTPKKDPLASVANGRVAKASAKKGSAIKKEAAEFEDVNAFAHGIPSLDFGVGSVTGSLNSLGMESEEGMGDNTWPAYG
ncbi:hypothetical protein MBLNU230_g2115t1 [Neophaeotheca triangularis]